MIKRNGFYNDEFFNILEYCRKENLFLGEGTPNADILIIGKECGFNKKKSDRLKKVKQIGCLESLKKEILDISKEEVKSNLDRLSDDYLNKGLPKLKEDIGSNATWRNYHRLVSLIKGVSEDQITKGGRNDWGFLDSCFITELSQIQLPNSNYLEKEIKSDKIRSDSIAKRSKMFHHPFFRRFPIVIVAVGPNYINIGKHKYDFDIEREFKVEYDKNPIHFKVEVSKKTNRQSTRWFNIHHSKSGSPNRIVIHTRQFSTRGEPNESLYPLLDRIANTCREFIEKKI